MSENQRYQPDMQNVKMNAPPAWGRVCISIVGRTTRIEMARWSTYDAEFPSRCHIPLTQHPVGRHQHDERHGDVEEGEYEHDVGPYRSESVQHR